VVENLALFDGVADSIIKSVQLNLLTDDRYMMIFRGLCTTITITIFAFIIATFLGVALTAVALRNRHLRRIFNIYSSLLEALPMLILLLLVYYIVFAKSSLHPLYISSIAFGVGFSPVIAKIFIEGIERVTNLQIEAATAMGFSVKKVFVSVIFPNALQSVLPSFCEAFVVLLKETAIVGFIAVDDLTRAGDQIRAQTFDAFFPVLFVAAIYFIAIYAITKIFEHLQGKIIGRKA
jgi:polar amino acid transport system substrate-binding protein